tara:strand:+ start:696 stop:1361 length:666 start_codon:yes stop_codon:yes gene_type:complete
MPVITSGKTFANGEQLTADKLNQVITSATFNQADAVDNSTMTIIGGAMAVADSGIVESKIANSNVTKAKIENVANMKALGNTSGSAAAPQEVAILDENDMTSDSDTSLATQQSIKAYVDNLPGIKAHCFWDGTDTGTNAPISGSGVTSVTRTTTGSWTINLSVTAPSASFTVLASADPVASSSKNYSTGASPSSTTQALVRREDSSGTAHDTTQMSFAAIW